MASKTEKAREAKVRASRAKSRVVAKRRSRAESAKRESREKIAATYTRARERMRAARAVDSAPPMEKKKEADRNEIAERRRKERGRKYFPSASVRREAGKKDEGREESGRGGKKKRGHISTGGKPNEASPVPVSGGVRIKRRKEKTGNVAEERPFRGGAKGLRRSRREEGEKESIGFSARPDGSELAAEGERKERRGEKRTLRMAVLGSLLVISLAALLWTYTGTGVLNIKSVEVKGNEKLGTDYLKALSGVTRQSHLLKMDVGAVERALLSEPYIAAVDVSRIFPNKVVLEITERRPTAFILQNGVYSLVDEEGVILESVEDRPQGLIEIKDLDLPLLLPGSAIGDTDFAMVNSLLASLPPSLQEMAATAGYIEGEGLYIESGDTIVIYGDTSELAYKNTIALMALTDLMNRYGAVEYIDVSFPDHPVIKPVGST